MSVEYVGAGTYQAGAAGLTVPIPAGLQKGDLLLLPIFSGNQTIATPTTTTGIWTQVGNQTVQAAGTPGAANAAVRLAVYYKFSTAAEASATVGDSGNVNVAQMFAFRDVDLLRPFHVTASAVSSSATTAISCPSVNTSVSHCRIVNCVGNGRDANATDGVTSEANANLGSFATLSDRVVNTSTGGGISIFSGDKITIGSTGNTTGTNGGSTIYAYLTIGLRPRRFCVQFG